VSGDGVVPADLPIQAGQGEKPGRLHYLDWLRVLLILGVFLYHALHPFDSTIDWHIKNGEQSVVVMVLPPVRQHVTVL